jgi:excisionase family DNA binding protein
MSPKMYWSYKAAHEHTGLPLGTLYALVSTKRIPHVRLNRRHVLFPVEDLLNWLDGHKVKCENTNFITEKEG